MDYIFPHNYILKGIMNLNFTVQMIDACIFLIYADVGQQARQLVLI